MNVSGRTYAIVMIDYVFLLILKDKNKIYTLNSKIFKINMKWN